MSTRKDMTPPNSEVEGADKKRPGPPKGIPKVPGSGRKAGTPNKVSGSVRLMILGALNKLGGERYLVQLGKDEPKAFAQLVSRLVPHEVTGADGTPLIPAQQLDTREVARRVAFTLAEGLQKSKAGG